MNKVKQIALAVITAFSFNSGGKIVRDIHPEDTLAQIDRPTLLYQAHEHQLSHRGDISFSELSTLEEGEDYEIIKKKGRSPIVIIAPHGGVIEPGTDLLAESIAGSRYHFYGFVAHTQKCDKTRCRSLHITSTEYREPTLLSTLSDVDTAVSIHSYGSRAKDQEGESKENIIIGGKNVYLREQIAQSLRKAGFPVEVRIKGTFAGADPHNFVNLAKEGGVQIEISRKLMRCLYTMQSKDKELHPTKEAYTFIETMRGSIAQYEQVAQR